MSATLRQIVNDALGIVGEVAGPGVQAYSEDRMMADAVRSFNLIFKKRHWEQYRGWMRLALDGTTGLVVGNDMEAVVDFENIIAVHRDAEPRPLPILPLNINPYTFIAGTSATHWTGLKATHASYAMKRIQIYPIASTGYINVNASLYPRFGTETDWNWDDPMYFDRDMLAYGTAFMTLSGDDLNPGGAEVAKNMMEMKYKDITNLLSSHPIPLRGTSSIPTTWREYPPGW